MNGKLQTSNPDIYAIGDVAAFPLHNYGLNKMFRQEHVANCRQSAKHAGAAAPSCDGCRAVVSGSSACISAGAGLLRALKPEQ